jgi:AcrR family transcriptional regulator
MTEPAASARTYHHGDLRRALVEAAERLLESEGPAALSLRAVAREAGVSSAAPYHHFKDKGELLDAVALRGWERLMADLARAKGMASTTQAQMTALSVEYVGFACRNRALYRVMFEQVRGQAMGEGPEQMQESLALNVVRDTLVEAGADPADELGLALASTAAWGAAHGLAEMASFRQFDALREALGGEEAFLRAVFDHMRIFADPPPR